MKYTRIMMVAVMAALMGTAQEKVAVVQMVDLVRFHPNSERDRKLMQDTEKEFQSKLDKRRDRFDQMRSEFEALVKESRNPALNDKARSEAEDKAAKHRTVLAEAERDLRQELQKYQRDLADMETRLLRQITGELRDVVSKYAKENKYTIIMDGTSLPYFDEKLDVTDQVLKQIGIDPKVRKEAKAKEAAEKAAADKK